MAVGSYATTQGSTTTVRGSGTVTPQAILNFEDFNSDKSVLRMTTDRVLNSNALQKEVQLPIGVIVNLYGELLTREGVVAVSFGQKAIVRCKDCRS